MRLRFLPIALLLLPLSACSKTISLGQTPPLQANLAQPCQALRLAPVPLIDPDRLQWEAEVVAAYADCAARHITTVRAWPGS